MDPLNPGRVTHEAASFQVSEEESSVSVTENGQRRCTDGAPSLHSPQGWRGNRRAPRPCLGARKERSYAG